VPYQTFSAESASHLPSHKPLMRWRGVCVALAIGLPLDAAIAFLIWVAIYGF